MGQEERNLLPSSVLILCCTIHTSLKSLKIVLDGDPSIYETIVGVILISRILVLYDFPAETTVRRKLKAEFSPILRRHLTCRLFSGKKSEVRHFDFFDWS